MISPLHLLFAFLMAIAGTAQAQTIAMQVEWDAVDDDRVGVYVVGVGPTSGQYDVEMETTDTLLSIPEQGFQVYHVAAKACTPDKSVCSRWSDEIDVPYIQAPQIQLKLTWEISE